MLTTAVSPPKQTSIAEASEYNLAADNAVIPMADGSARILNMRDRFYAVPPVAALMLRETLENGTDAAVQRIAADYGVEQDLVEADLKTFLATLEKRGIIRRKADNGRSRFLGARLVAAMFGLTFRLLPTSRLRAAALLSAAKIFLHTLGWARTVEAFRRQFPAKAADHTSSQAESLAQAIDEKVRNAAAWNPIGVACKERALTCWALARGAGLPAVLVVGVELFPFSGHCWCEVGSRIISDDAENCVRYLSALRYE
jgi:hypothetical protein